MTNETDLEKYRPRLTDVEIVKAAEVYSRGDEILSLNGKRTAIDAFVLILATDSQSFGPFLLNGVCARELCALLADAGYEPRSK